MRAGIIAIVVVFGLASAAAQQAAPDAAAPQMVRAAGMPLSDGALPPGTLTVRVVQGAFTSDLAGMTVDVEVDGRPDLHAQTKAQGRAEFVHLPIGAEVRASAVVNGERLQSDAFRMPAESGVRVLLIVGGDSPPTLGADVPAAAEPPDNQRAVRAVQIAVVALTVLAFVVVLTRPRSSRR